MSATNPKDFDAALAAVTKELNELLASGVPEPQRTIIIGLRIQATMSIGLLKQLAAVQAALESLQKKLK